MAQKQCPNLVFTVRRSEPELIAPSKPTPLEWKLLSDIDDQHSLRFQLPLIQFYRNNDVNSSINKDPVKVIRDALAEALVFYYPFAGRLREGPGGKLIVECTGEGVLFMEADADVRMEQFGEELLPPFPCFEELLYNVPGSDAILNSPLLLVQVTRILCGGFIFTLRINHTLSDGTRVAQFVKAMGEMARGARTPSVRPVWQRELLGARDPPHVTCTHHEYDDVVDTKGTTVSLLADVDHRSFLFGSTELLTLRKLIPQHLSKCSTFDVLTACLWRCRTIALQLDPNQEVRILCVVNIQGRLRKLLPNGYYGNGIVFPAAISTVKKLSQNSLAYALELVMNAKYSVTDEYVKSAADLMVTKGRPHFPIPGSWFVSDTTRLGIKDADFGWGKAEYSGLATGRVGAILGLISFYLPFRNDR
ncbi:hypothetical protein LguiB_022299 [Lonicera macranthoides]